MFKIFPLLLFMFIAIFPLPASSIQWLHTYDEPEIQYRWDVAPYAVRHFHRFWESYNSLWLKDLDATAIRFVTGSLTYDSMILLEEARTTIPLSNRIKFQLHHKRVEDDPFPAYPTDYYGRETFVFENEVLYNQWSIIYTSDSGIKGGVITSWSSDKDYIDPGVIIGYNFNNRTSIEYSLVGRDLFQKWLVNKSPVDHIPFQNYLGIYIQFPDSIKLICEGYVETPSGKDLHRKGSNANSTRNYEHRLQVRMEKNFYSKILGLQVGTTKYFYQNISIQYNDSLDFVLSEHSQGLTDVQHEVSLFVINNSIPWSWEINCLIIESWQKEIPHPVTRSYEELTQSGISINPRAYIRRYFGTKPYIEIELEQLYKYRKAKSIENTIDRTLGQNKLRYGFAIGYTLNGSEVAFNGKTKTLPTGEFRIMYSFDDPYPEAGDFGGAGSAAFVLTW